VQGFFFCLLSVGEGSPEEGQIRRERICTLRSNGLEGGGQDARRSCQASNKAEGHPQGWPFCVAADKRRAALHLPGLQTLLNLP